MSHHGNPAEHAHGASSYGGAGHGSAGHGSAGHGAYSHGAGSYGSSGRPPMPTAKDAQGKIQGQRPGEVAEGDSQFHYALYTVFAREGVADSAATGAEATAELKALVAARSQGRNHPRLLRCLSHAQRR